MKTTTIQATAALLACVLATAAFAVEKKPVPSAQPEAVSGGAMQVAFFDPITGQLRAPTPEEAAAFAKSVQVNRQRQALLPSTSGRPRTEQEALKTLRKVRIKGIQLELMDAAESEMSNVVGKRDAAGRLVAAHPGDAPSASAAEVTQ
jgi:hypothetical protein